jgi:hypothetical protein
VRGDDGVIAPAVTVVHTKSLARHVIVLRRHARLVCNTTHGSAVD